MIDCLAPWRSGGKSEFVTAYKLFANQLSVLNQTFRWFKICKPPLKVQTSQHRFIRLSKSKLKRLDFYPGGEAKIVLHISKTQDYKTLRSKIIMIIMLIIIGFQRATGS